MSDEPADITSFQQGQQMASEAAWAGYDGVSGFFEVAKHRSALYLHRRNLPREHDRARDIKDERATRTWPERNTCTRTIISTVRPTATSPVGIAASVETSRPSAAWRARRTGTYNPNKTCRALGTHSLMASPSSAAPRDELQHGLLRRLGPPDSLYDRPRDPPPPGQHRRRPAGGCQGVLGHASQERGRTPRPTERIPQCGWGSGDNGPLAVECKWICVFRSPHGGTREHPSFCPPALPQPL